MAPSCSCSSQLPVGTVRTLEQSWQARPPGATVSFACSPENLRLGKAIEVFTNPDRVVVGVRDERARARVAGAACADHRSHRVDVGRVGGDDQARRQRVSRDVGHVHQRAGGALRARRAPTRRRSSAACKTERRIGPHAYLSPGGAFAGGTLARDVTFLRALGTQRRSADAADGRRAREQHRAPHVGAAPARVGRSATWPARRSPSGASPTSRAPTRFAGPTPSSCAAGSSSQGADVHVHDPAAAALPDDLRGDAPRRSARRRCRSARAGRRDRLAVYREVDVDRLAARRAGPARARRQPLSGRRRSGSDRALSSRRRGTAAA